MLCCHHHHLYNCSHCDFICVLILLHLTFIILIATISTMALPALSSQRKSFFSQSLGRGRGQLGFDTSQHLNFTNLSPKIGQNSIEMTFFCHLPATYGQFSTHISCQRWSGESFVKIGCWEVSKPNNPPLLWPAEWSSLSSWREEKMRTNNWGFKLKLKPIGRSVSRVAGRSWLVGRCTNWSSQWPGHLVERII